MIRCDELYGNRIGGLPPRGFNGVHGDVYALDIRFLYDIAQTRQGHSAMCELNKTQDSERG